MLKAKRMSLATFFAGAECERRVSVGDLPAQLNVQQTLLREGAPIHLAHVAPSPF